MNSRTNAVFVNNDARPRPARYSQHIVDGNNGIVAHGTRSPSEYLRMTLLRLLPVILLTCSASFAQQVELTSPLDGYIRPGKSAAVQIRADSLAGTSLTLSGSGLIPVSIPINGGRVDAIVPLLWQAEAPAELNWSDGRAGGVATLRS